MTDSFSEQVAQTHQEAQQGWQAVEDNTKGKLPNVFKRLSRRNFLKTSLIVGAGVMAAESGILGHGVETAHAQEAANVLKLVKAEISQEAAAQIGNQNLIELMGQRLNPYQRLRITFTPEEVLGLADVTPFSARSLQDVVSTIETYGGQFQLECTVFCDENQEFSITFPSFMATAEFEGDGHTFVSGTLFVIDGQGIPHYIEPNQVISPSMADILVVSPELKAAQTESYTHNGLSLNFNDFENGDVILVERTASQTDSQLLQVVTNEATFPLAELRVYSGSGSAPNIRRERSTDSEAIRVANAHDIYVTPFQLSLETIRAEASLNAAGIQRDDQGRFFVMEGQYQWSLVEVRDDQNMHTDYGWVRNDVAGNPNISYTATPLPPEVVSIEPTETPPASEVVEDSQFPIRENPNGGYDVHATVESINETPFTLSEGVEVQYSLNCSFIDINGQNREFILPLAIYNSSTTETAVIGHGVYAGAPFQLQAFRNAYASVQQGGDIVFGIDSDLAEYGQGSSLTVFSVAGEWISANINQSNIEQMVGAGNIDGLSTVQGNRCVVPFFVGL